MAINYSYKNIDISKLRVSFPLGTPKKKRFYFSVQCSRFRI